MANKVEPHILVIFGASGDLAQRKLVPAVYDLYRGDYLPEHFALLGASRTDFTDEQFREKVVFDNEFMEGKPREQMEEFSKLLFYQDLKVYDGKEDVDKLKVRLDKLSQEFSTGPRYIFYLSTPPKLYSTIPHALAASGTEQAGRRLGAYRDRKALRLR